MQPRALVLALISAGAALHGAAHGADDYCSKPYIYAVNQVCQPLPNGLTQCQQIGLAGPAPGCTQPGGATLVPVPLAPPVLMPPPMANPYLPGYQAPPVANPYLPAPAYQPPLAANPYLPATAYPPRPVWPMPLPWQIPPVAGAAAPAPATPATGVTATPVSPAPTAAPTQAKAPAAAPMPAPLPIAAPVPAPAPSAMPAHAPAPAAAPAAPPATTVAPAAPAASAPVAAPAPSANAASTAPGAPAAPVAPAPAAAGSDEALAHFAFASAELTEAGRATLDAWLARAPKGKRVSITGYADRLGPAPYNLKLSRQRAEAVRRYLTGKGLNAKRIRLVAKGEAAPVKHCPGGATPATKACLAPNRRVVIDP